MSSGGDGTYPFVPAKENSAIDTFSLTTQFESLVEILHKCVALVDRDRLDCIRDVA